MNRHTKQTASPVKGTRFNAGRKGVATVCGARRRLVTVRRRITLGIQYAYSYANLPGSYHFVAHDALDTS